MIPGTRQRLAAHKSRKAASRRREKARFVDGKGKERVAASRARAWSAAGLKG